MSVTAERPLEQEVPLLAPDEPPPFEALNAQGAQPVLFVCDHAGRRIARALGDLGLDEAARRSHLAWDVGAAEVTRKLSAQLNARPCSPMTRGW